MLRKPSRFWIVAALTLCTSLAATSWGRANERATEFNIPPQSLDSALLVFAKQAAVQVSVSTTTIAGMRTPGVVGKFTPSVALTRLLAETDLQFSTVGDRTYAVVQEPAIPAVGAEQSKAASSTAPTTPSETAAAASTRAVEGAKKKNPGNDTNGGPDTAELGDLVVTGSSIRGLISTGSPVLVFDREDIDRSGYATVQDFLQDLPQNFGGGPSEDFGGIGNFNRGSSVNLRGLGASSTLVLVNGRRQPASGTDADFVDVSTIPSSAIDRIEVLTDGASAIYGSDAIGGVINVILRKNYDGAKTQVRFATAGGDSDETVLAQLFGTSWTTGNALFGYQYYKKTALTKADRSYAADSDKTPLGGTNLSSFQSNPGNILDPATFEPVFAIPSGQDGSGLTPGQLLPGVVNFQNEAEGTDLLPEARMHSAFMTATQDISPQLQLFVEGRFSERNVTTRDPGWPEFLFVPSTNPFFVDPFGGSTEVFVAYNFVDDLGPQVGTGETRTYASTLGASVELGADWQATLAGTYGKEKLSWQGTNGVNSEALSAALADPDPATAFNPFGDGSHSNPATLDAIRLTQNERAVSDVLIVNAIADGPLLEISGGTSKLAVGADYRDEGLDRGVVRRTELGRSIFAGFAEFAIPLVGSGNGRPGMRRLELSVAGRYEDYSDFGTSLNPKIGLRYSPSESVALRGSWGRSFRAPKLIELDDMSIGPNNASLFPLPDPQSATGQSMAILRFGNNAGLDEETATTWTAGIDFVPERLPALQLSVTYYEIDYKDRIAVPGPPDSIGILFEEEQWSDIIIRNPPQALVDEICNSPIFFGSPSECTSTPPEVIADFRVRNLSVVKARGLDFIAEHVLATELGNFGFGLSGNYTLAFEQATTDGSPLVELTDTVNNPLGLRLRGEVAWSKRGFGASASINYTGSYDDVVSQPNRKVDSWETVDLQLRYEDVGSKGWLQGVAVALTAVNIFDEAPPFVNQRLGYDLSNANSLGRFVSVQLKKDW